MNPMVAITFNRSLVVSPPSSPITLNAGERFVFPNDHAARLLRDNAEDIYEFSEIVLPLQTPIVSGSKVLLARPSGGFGDILCLTGVCHFLFDMGAKVFVATDEAYLELWQHNPHIVSLLTLPFNLDAVFRAAGRPFFDTVFFLERAGETVSDSEQPNCYDQLFGLLGFSDVPDKYKIPHMTLIPDELDQLKKWKASQKIREYLVFTPLAIMWTRSLPVPVIQRVLDAASEVARERGWRLVVTNGTPFSDEIKAMIKKAKALDASCHFGTRGVAALISGAKGVVTPDSGAVHFSAAFNTPCVSIFALHSPESRVKYYPNNRSIFHPEMCPRAPCFEFSLNLPHQKCVRRQAQKYCECFDAVRQNEISEALTEILKEDERR
jgi:ADP-heptose:LPS heptosyltransferase